jgi:hypothetical protein
MIWTGHLFLTLMVPRNETIYYAHENDGAAHDDHGLGGGGFYRASWRRGICVLGNHAFGDIRVRMVEYSPGYAANHWCSKGHVILCLGGSLEIRLRDGTQLSLKPGQSYHVGDGDPSHRSSTATGAKLFIVDWRTNCRRQFPDSDNLVDVALEFGGRSNHIPDPPNDPLNSASLI